MKTFENFDWGNSSNWFIETMISEHNQLNIYQKFFEVEQNDIVMDIGASVGDFIWSIKDKKPKHCWVVEPTKNYQKTLLNNLMGLPVSFVNVAVSHYKDILINWDGKITKPRVVTFKELIEETSLEKIDFLKIDCEGGEYDIFSFENINFLKKNVKKIVVEFHLSTPILKGYFINFRNNILPEFSNFKIMSVDNVDILWDLQNEHFIKYYNEVLIYIDNR